MLEIHDLVVRRGTFTVELPHLVVPQGHCVALCGVSGSGKSTLLEAIALLSPWERIRGFAFKGVAVDKLSAREAQALRVSQMGIMPQVGGLIPYLSLEENLKIQIALALHQQTEWDDGEDSALATSLRVVDCYTRARAREYLEALGPVLELLHLREHLHKLPHELSIGQRQRALFVRAIAHQPRLIVIDEPTSYLDPDNAHALFALIDEIALESNLSVLLVTHDTQVAERYRCYHYDATRSHLEHSIFVAADAAGEVAMAAGEVSGTAAEAAGAAASAGAGAVRSSAGVV